MTQFNFEAIGTVWQVDLYSELTEEKKNFVLSKIKDRIELFDKVYSRFRGDSLVSKMSKESGAFLLPPDAEEMISIYHDLYVRTNGLFTPLIGNMISDAGYDAEYSLSQKKELQTPPKWDDVLDYQKPNLIIKKSVLLDFGAAGKGYLVDLVGKVLEDNNIYEYCIDAGGDILHKGKDIIKVGLENPIDVSQVIGVCSLENGSICGSAGNRRAWGEFTHIMNPQTLSSPKHILAVWVTAQSAIVADAIATCLFFIEPTKLSPFYDFEYVIIRSDNSLDRSQGFRGEIFTQ